MNTLKGDVVVMTNEPNPIKTQFIEILHQAALNGQLGYMDGKDPDTGEIVPLLVGIEREGSMIRAYPIAHAFLKVEEMKNYLAPDGQGNYLDLTTHITDANGEPVLADFGTLPDAE